MKNFLIEFKRKFLLHLLSGISMAIYLYFVPSFIFQISMICFLAIGLYLRLMIMRNYKSELNDMFIKNLGRKNEVGNGGIYYLMGLIIVSLYFPKNISIIAILVLSISDTLSTLFGKFLGKIKIYKKKTLIGTFTFLFSSFLIILAFTQNIILSLFTSFFSSLIELFTPVDDNLIIPPATALLISIFVI